MAAHYRPGVEIVPGYVLVSLLGRGGFGEVWKAKGPGGVMLAIKIIDKVDDKAGRKEFRSLKLIKDINHPNLVTIAGYWIKDLQGNLLDPEKIADESQAGGIRPAELIIAMDLGERSLQEYLSDCRKDLSPEQKGGLPVEELLDHIESAAKAIDYLNQRHDVQHRDIKPQNILIVGGGAKICDFGLASTVSAVRTSMGGAGSLAYMAPEVYTSKRPSRATDQYSLAIAYCELRTGRLPLPDESYSALDDAKRRGVLDLSWLDDAERLVIQKATSLNPEERYPRCIDMVRALRKAVASADESASGSALAKTFGDYVLRKRLFHRTGEEIWEAQTPEGHRVAVVVREMSEAPDTADAVTLALVRDVTRKHPGLAETYDAVRVNEQGKVLPARLFEVPNPPAFARLGLAGRLAPKNLGENIVAGGMQPPQLLPYFAQLAAAVDFLNERKHDQQGRKVGIVHGNLRPVNFLLSDNQVLLGNFASARRLEADVQDYPVGPRVLDDVYRPPEFAKGKLTRWSDQYMLAVAYLQIRSGRPSSGLSSSTLSGDGPESGRRLDMSDLYPAEREVIARATRPSPGERYPTCVDLVEALQAAWDQTSQSLPKPVSPPPSSHPTVPAPGRPTPSSPDVMPPRPSSSAGTVAGPAAALAMEPTAHAPSARDLALAECPPSVAGTMLAPGVQGTLLTPHAQATMTPPQLAETRISSDTDLREAETPRSSDAATVAERRETPTQSAPKRSLVPPVAPPSRTWTTPIAIGIAVAALGIGGYWYFNRDQHSPEPPSGPPSPRIAQEDQRWYDENVAPLVAQQDFPAALAKVAACPATVVQHRTLWRDAVLDGWYVVAKGLHDQQQFASLLTQLSALRKEYGGDFKSTAQWRLAALTHFLTEGERLLKENMPELAATAFARVVQAVDDVLKSGSPTEVELDALRQALVGRARANARRDQWTDVRPDVERRKKLGGLTGSDTAYLAALTALDPDHADGGAQAAAIESVMATHETVLDVAEFNLLKGALDRIRSGAAARDQQTIARTLDRAQEQIAKRDYAAAQQTLADLTPSKPLGKSLHAQRDRKQIQRFQEASALALLNAATTSEDADAGFAAARARLSEKAECDADWLVNVAAAAQARALVRAPQGDALLRPELVPTAAQLLQQLAAATKDETVKKKIAAILTPMQDELARKQLIDILKARNEALASKAYETLLDACVQAEKKGVRHPLVAACQAEALVELDHPPAEWSPLHERIKLAPPSGAEGAYLSYVRGLLAARDGATLEAADFFAAAWPQLTTEDGKPPPLYAWQKSPVRCNRAVATLIEAGQQLQDLPGDDPRLTDDRFTKEKAERAWKWYQVAAILWPQANVAPAAKRDPAEKVAIDVNRALTSAYAGRPNAAALLDPLVELPPDKASSHVLLASIAERTQRYAQDKLPATRNAVLVAYGKLWEYCRERTSVKVDTVFDRVLTPAFEFITQSAAKPSESSPDARAAVAAICAARGRAIRVYSAIERRVSAGGKVDPLAQSFASFDQAVNWDPSRGEYFVGRGLATYLMADTEGQNKSDAIRQDAAQVRALGKNDPQQQCLASGLEGLATFLEALTTVDFAERVKKLSAAEDALRRATEVANLPESFQRSDEFQRFLLSRGGAFLHLANFVPQATEKRKWLEKGVAHVESIVKKYPYRANPERAYELWGNTLEDFALFNVDPKGYSLSWPKFEEQLRLTDADDARGRARARINLARSILRHEEAALLAAQNQRDNVPKVGDSAEERQRKAQALAAADRQARPGLSRARSSLESAIKEAVGFPATQADAYNWLGKIDQLSPFDNFEQSDKSFGEAARLAAPHDPYWPVYVLDQAENRLRFARRHLTPGAVDEESVRNLLVPAREMVRVLETKDDPRIHERHRVQAIAIQFQTSAWLGEATAAEAAFAQIESGKLSTAGKFDLALQIAERILSLGRDPDRFERLVDSVQERTWALEALRAAQKLAANFGNEHKSRLFLGHEAAFMVWDPQFVHTFKQYTASRTPELKQRAALLLRQNVAHMELAVALIGDPAWSKHVRESSDPKWQERAANFPGWKSRLDNYQTKGLPALAGP